MIKCEYCTGKVLLQKDEIIHDLSFGWGNPEIKLNRQECREYSLAVFIDRGYLRHVDPEDSQCMDHGQNIKINYCPMCGRNLNPCTEDSGE